MLKNQQIALWGFPYMLFVAFPLLLGWHVIGYIAVQKWSLLLLEGKCISLPWWWLAWPCDLLCLMKCEHCVSFPRSIKSQCVNCHDLFFLCSPTSHAHAPSPAWVLVRKHGAEPWSNPQCTREWAINLWCSKLRRFGATCHCSLSCLIRRSTWLFFLRGDAQSFPATLVTASCFNIRQIWSIHLKLQSSPCRQLASILNSACMDPNSLYSLPFPNMLHHPFLYQWTN